MQKESSLLGCLNQIKMSRRKAAPLYSAQKHCGMTNGAESNSPALVIPVLAVRAHAGYSAGYKSGFTLIELLVVVLIIGILASVALPQYQKAVEKSRVATLLAAMKSIVDAEEAYYLANGEYTKDLDNLSVDIPFKGTEQNGSWTYYILPNNLKISLYETTEVWTQIIGGTSRIQIDWALEHGGSAAIPGIHCGADPSDKVGIATCKTFGSNGQKSNDTYNRGCTAFTGSMIYCDWYQISL